MGDQEMSVQVTRAGVLQAFKAVPAGAEISTTGLAWLCGCDEHRIRAAVSWLALGGIIELAGKYPRRDRRGRTYRARLYRWSGREEIARVPRDAEDRRRVRELEQQGDAMSLAMAWLSRPVPKSVTR